MGRWRGIHFDCTKTALYTIMNSVWWNTPKNVHFQHNNSQGSLLGVGQHRMPCSKTSKIKHLHPMHTATYPEFAGSGVTASESVITSVTGSTGWRGQLILRSSATPVKIEQQQDVLYVPFEKIRTWTFLLWSKIIVVEDLQFWSSLKFEKRFCLVGTRTMPTCLSHTFWWGARFWQPRKVEYKHTLRGQTCQHNSRLKLDLGRQTRNQQTESPGRRSICCITCTTSRCLSKYQRFSCHLIYTWKS